jgi:hypothetical protein
MNDSSVPSAYALLADGSTVHIRPARPEDASAVKQMHANLSPSNTYFRFFNLSPLAPEREAKRVTRPEDADHVALLALLAGELVGVATTRPPESQAGPRSPLPCRTTCMAAALPCSCSSIWCRLPGSAA